MIIMYFLFLDDRRFPAGQVFGPVGKDSATFFAFPSQQFSTGSIRIIFVQDGRE